MRDPWSSQFQKDGVYLVPPRVFIGLGWLRAGAEKLTDPGWLDGTALSAFLVDHLQRGDVAIPLYASLMANVWLPNVGLLAVVVLVGQLLAGVAILLGGFTNAALIAGMFMNVNFVLAGEPNPSAFYFVIQAALLSSRTGAVLGLDIGLSRLTRSSLLVA